MLDGMVGCGGRQELWVQGWNKYIGLGRREEEGKGLPATVLLCDGAQTKQAFHGAEQQPQRLSCPTLSWSLLPPTSGSVKVKALPSSSKRNVREMRPFVS